MKQCYLDVLINFKHTFAVTPSLFVSESAVSGNTNQDHILTCNSGVSRPEPTLKWYKNGLVLPIGNNTQGYAISHSTTSYSGDLYVVQSVLTIQNSWYNNGDVVTCQASSNEVTFEIVSKTVILSKPNTGKTFIFIRPSSDGTYYGMVMSVRPGLRSSVRQSVRPSVTVFRTFLLHALRYWAEILCKT